MERVEFYTVHKDFAQEGPIYGHEEYYGLPKDEAMAKYHGLLNSAWLSSDPWTHVYVENDAGARIMWELIDRRTVSPVEALG